MSIRKYEGQELKPGMVVCRRSVMTNGICSRPVTITRVCKSRAEITDGEEVRLIGISTICFIVDSIEEGMRLFEISCDFLKQEERYEREHHRARSERKIAAIAKATGSQS
jgi:hypothetical protein